MTHTVTALGAEVVAGDRLTVVAPFSQQNIEVPRQKKKPLLQ